LLLAAAVITVLVYWTGLSGPFLMDDHVALKPIASWLAGTVPLGEEVLFNNTSWLTHRSLSMATLAANAAWLGYGPASFKLGNLAVHLACGLAAYGWLSSLLARDPGIAHRGHLVAALLAAAWLLHPLNVSTVLYAVQRMAQMATLCCLLGMWLYVHVRTDMQNQHRTRDWFYLLLGIPMLTLAGIQGKQNAAVLPLLCLVIELAYFQRPRDWPASVRTFFATTVAFPAILGALVLLLRPQALLADYGLYEFGVVDRLLSEARVLCDYLRLLLVPYPPAMGVYTDDFAASTGLLSPPTTLLSISVLAVLSAISIRWRASLPSLSAGWFVFLVGHAVESSLLPLELYYEHRNYLPAFGVLLAVAGLVGAAGRRLDALGIRSGRIGWVAVAAALAVLALQTHGRARVWGDAATLATSALRAHPDSVRAHLGYLSIAVTNEPAVYERALDATFRSSNRRVRASAGMFRLIVNCERGQKSVPADLLWVTEEYPAHIDILESVGYRTLATHASNKGCPGLGEATIADALVSVVDRAKAQPESVIFKWAIRNDAARLYARVRAWDDALRQAQIAWKHSGNTEIAEVLVLALLEKGEIDHAEQIYRETTRRAPASGRNEALLLRLRSTIDHYRANSPARYDGT
jgi:protein O-mannosyl-transferase